jgi:hypothetical protein
MRRSRHNFARRQSPPIFRIALALFAVVCGAVLLLASWRKGGDSGDRESALEQRMRSAASQVYQIADESRAAIGEVEAARNALEAMDYGRSRRLMQNAEDALDGMAARLDTVGAMLRNGASPRPAEAEAESQRGE